MERNKKEINSVIKVENLCKSYITYKRGSGFRASVKSFIKRDKVYVDAVKNISFEIKRGNIVGVLGPNGAGKSTTIKMLTGTLYPTSGNIYVNGNNPCKKRTEYVKKIGAVFGQKSQLIFDIPPIDSFKMNKAIYGIPNDIYQEGLNTMVDLLDLGDIIMRPTRVLSLGERMKCEFIMAMLHKPDIVFLDEPTIGLDVIAKQNIREFIKDMNEKGVTFILTTHDLEDVEKLAKDVIIINKGEKVFDGSIDDLRKNLGEKKIVELTLTENNTFFNKLDNDFFIEGIQLIEKVNDYQIMLEVDIDILPIKKFMELLVGQCSFSDISIKELPMEKIITRIYEKTK